MRMRETIKNYSEQVREIEWEVVSAVRDDDKRGGLEGFREVIRRTRDGVFKPRVVTMANADNLPVPPQYAQRYLSVRICSTPYQYRTKLGTFFASIVCVILWSTLRIKVLSNMICTNSGTWIKSMGAILRGDLILCIPNHWINLWVLLHKIINLNY